MSSTIPTRPGTNAPVDDETRRIVEERLATADGNPKQDYLEALAHAVREGRKEVAKLKHPVPR
jgi:hypothetical protein